MSVRYDAVVVGAGPAGLATALALARRGARAVVVDAREPPIDKACGEGLMPDAVDALDSLGVRVSGMRFDGIRWIDERGEVEGTFPGRPGFGIRRLRLHAALVRAAEEAGIDVRWRTPLRALDEHGIRTNRGRIVTRFTVGADGLRSTVRRLAGLAGAPTRRVRFGIRRHYQAAPWSRKVEVYWDAHGEVYVTPVGPGEIGVAVLSHGPPDRIPSIRDRFPALADRLAGARCSSPRRGAGPLEQRVTSVRRGRVLLVGDAAGYVDAVTGEGLASAFRQALALADVIGRGALARWPAEHRRATRRADRFTRWALTLARRPRLRRAAFALLERCPGSFDRILAAATGPTTDRGAMPSASIPTGPRH